MGYLWHGESFVILCTNISSAYIVNSVWAAPVRTYSSTGPTGQWPAATFEVQNGRRLGTWLEYFQLKAISQHLTREGSLSRDLMAFKDVCLQSEPPARISSLLYNLLPHLLIDKLPTYIRAWKRDLGCMFDKYNLNTIFALTHSLNGWVASLEWNFKIVSRWYRFLIFMIECWVAASNEYQSWYSSPCSPVRSSGQRRVCSVFSWWQPEAWSPGIGNHGLSPSFRNGCSRGYNYID